MRDMFNLLALQLRGFQAHLTWVELSNLYLLHACEASPRLAFMTLPASRVFITFVTRLDAGLARPSSTASLASKWSPVCRTDCFRV
jgi:hypothetical protein